MALIAADLRPRAILTPAAFRNAVRVAVAIGASVNVPRHLIATSIEAGLSIDLIREFEAAAHLGQVTRVRPNGPDRIETFAAAGGCSGAMQQIARELDTQVLTVTGRTLAENLSGRPAPDAAVIRPLDDPWQREPGLLIVRGNLAPDGAVIKLSAVPKHIRRYSAPAVVFEDESAAINGLENGRVHANQVVVLRMLGPKGGPGTVFAASFMAALVGAGFGDSVAVVTDGELSGLNSGITIGQVMPEAAEGGPLAIVRDGDEITIDITARTIELGITDDELAARLSQWVPPAPVTKRGWLAMYQQLVQPLSQGAVLGTQR